MEITSRKLIENRTKTTRKPSKGLILNTFFIIKNILAFNFMKVKGTILMKNISFIGLKHIYIKKKAFFNKNITFKFDITDCAEYNPVQLNTLS